MTHDELTIRIIELSGDDTKNWKFYPALRAVVLDYISQSRVICLMRKPAHTVAQRKIG
jgi:hypothetical protein